jgi:hypothetical protein
MKFHILLIALVFAVSAPAADVAIEVSQSGPLTIRHHSLANVTLRSPDDGLWSIGTGWKDDTAERWQHASPASVSSLGPWQVVSGTVPTVDGEWTVSDQYRVDERGLIHAKRRWQYGGAKPSGPVVLSIRFAMDRLEGQPLLPFLPGIQYFGNPSGTRIDSARVPTWSSEHGEVALYEEHRYPMPLAAAGQDGQHVVALHSRPSRLPFAARDDLWWSLGLVETDSGTELVMQSGPVASNGRRGVVKARQTKFLPYPDAHLTGVEPGAVIEKEYWLQLTPDAARGHWFRHPLWSSIRLFDPVADQSMPSPVEVHSAKLRDTFGRWREDERSRGFRTRPPQAQPWFMMGWADRAEVPGHALLALDLSSSTDRPDLWKRRAALSLDFLCTSPPEQSNRGDGFSIVYDYDNGEWLARHNPLSQAQALLGIARAARTVQASESLRVDPSKWKEFLRLQLTTIRDRVTQPDWRPVSTNEAFAIAPLVIGSQLLEDQSMMSAARRIADHTIERHLDMQEPYWGGTLDARCEDKEGAWAALQGFAALYEAEHEPKYLNAAIHAADVCLSYLYVWDVELPAGRLADHAVKTRGWTGVSVQNQHLDVFGVVFTPVLWQLGEWTGNERYRQLARLMFVSCGQMTDLATGLQGEQLFQTNYQQHDATDAVERMRGGYSERWNIFWITAHFLTAAAEFERLGVEWRGF